MANSGGPMPIPFDGEDHAEDNIGIMDTYTDAVAAGGRTGTRSQGF